MQCFSCLTEHKSNSDEKSNQNQSDTKQDLQAIQILLLGAGSSGKTTIIKQIKRIHHTNDTQEARDCQQTSKYIKEAVITNMKILCDESVRLNKVHQFNTLVDSDNECIHSEISTLQFPYTLTAEIAFKIRVLWNDEGIQNTLSHRQYFQIPENAGYFFDHIDTISSSTYAASFDDYIRFRQITAGLSQTKIKINFGNHFGDQMFQFTDVGGQKSQRRKMKYAADDANAVIYVVGLSDYDLNAYEDNTTNRLNDSIELFREMMITHKMYENRTVVLFFNKYDLFQAKIKIVPITSQFDDFPNDLDPNDADDVVKFIGSKFLQVFQDAKTSLRSPLHIVRTTALDTDMIEKVFSNITLDLVKRNLDNLNLL